MHKSFNKIFLLLIVFLLAVPFFALADSYDGPFCFETPSAYDTPDTSGIRGTCREVETTTVVSLDPALQKDYFLGTHSPIEYNCDLDGCMGSTINSESLFLTNSSTLKMPTLGVEESPLQYALFEKSYFVPLFSKMFKESGYSFSENTVPDIGIKIFKKSELDEINKFNYPYPYIPEGAKMDSLIQVSPELIKLKTPGQSELYDIYSLNYQEYGRYIYAPKDTLSESRYADFEKATNILTDKDLGINKYEGKHESIIYVPITNPLKSVTNYWTYTKKAGRLVLSWQKGEYVLDNGQVKVLTSADKNISTTLLFSNSFPAPSPKSAESVSPPTTNSVVLPPIEQKKGFFGRFFDFVLSWFK